MFMAMESYITKSIKKYNITNVQVLAFIERMDLVYAAADIIISCRSFFGI
jgi:UDP-N-acetylglucosamine--N-acetylmuramyl-(pentapeptide) pyrophosphoryl-undecaprenol N-acetylglucosamine transferase